MFGPFMQLIRLWRGSILERTRCDVKVAITLVAIPRKWAVQSMMKYFYACVWTVNYINRAPDLYQVAHAAPPSYTGLEIDEERYLTRK